MRSHGGVRTYKKANDRAVYVVEMFCFVQLTTVIIVAYLWAC